MCPPDTAHRRAFSLTELIVVIAVVVILTALLVPAVSDFGQGTRLASGGNLVTNLASYARQIAITRGTLTALILLGEQGTEDDYRAFIVLEYDAARGWSQATDWHRLPQGIVVDRFGERDAGDTTNATFLKNSPTSFFTADGQPRALVPPVRHRDQQVTRFAGRVFNASGALLNPEAPAELRLVEGFNENGRTIYTRRASDGRPANFYSIALLGSTGLARVERP